MRILLAVIALFSASCLRDTSFHCTTNAECGRGGTCQRDVGYCSVSDRDCPGGERYGDSAGPYAGKCVGDVAPTDAAVGDASGGDSASDASPGCPVDYVTITGGQTNHRYRLVNSSDNWADQRDFCAGTSSTAYLAIPDDLAELQAIATLSSASASWVGITDSATENVFLTLKGVPATFLPWDNNQPDDAGPGEDCVIIQTSSSKLRDDRCTDKYRAVCECEP